MTPRCAPEPACSAPERVPSSTSTLPSQPEKSVSSISSPPHSSKRLSRSVTAGRHSAIHHDLGTGDETRIITGQKERRPGRVTTVAHEAQGDSLETRREQCI